MKHFFRRLPFFLIRHGKLLLAACGILFVLSAVLTAFTQYSADLFEMFPAHSESRRNLSAIASGGLLNRAVIFFTVPEGKTFRTSGLPEFLETFASRVKQSPLTPDVLWRKNSLSGEKALLDFARFVPQYVSPDELPLAESKLDAAVRKCAFRLAVSPAGGRLLASDDPFGFTGRIYSPLEKLLRISGLRMNAAETCLVSEDSRRCIVIAGTTVPPADVRGCAALYRHLESCLTGLPPGVRAEILSAHGRTLANEAAVRADLKKFAWISALLFAAIFIVIYRCDWRGLAIPAIAFASIVPALGVMSLCFRPVLVFVIGIGGVIVGLGVDYGIHLYGVFGGGAGIRGMIRLIPALGSAFLTTALAFVFFMLIGTPAFLQFGTFSLLTLAFTFAGTAAAMPWIMFLTRKKPCARIFRFPAVLEQYPRVNTALFLVFAAVFAAGCLKVRISTDLRAFDVSGKEAARTEAEYRKAFSTGSTPLILLFTGKDSGAVLEQVSKAAESVSKQKNPPLFLAASELFPSPAVRRANLERWKKFTNSGELAAFEKRFFAKAGEAGFRTEFFRPYFTKLEQGIAEPSADVPAMLDFAHGFLMHETPRNVSALILAEPDSEAAFAGTGAVAVSEKSILRQMFSDISGNALPAGIAVSALILLCVLAFFRSVSRALPAVLPMLFALLAIFGVHGLTGTPINLSVLVSGIIVLGICVDYGILAVSSKPHDRAGLTNSITFSALTTAAGGLTVVFMEHQMLRSAGLTILTGIAAAWAASLFFPPLWKKENSHE